jgi:predicted acetyltransferase
VIMPAGGLGSLAVDLLHRKRKAAREMVMFYLEHYRQIGTSLALLYPFRTDFYRRMGFGYGPKMSRYVFRPAALRVRKNERRHIVYLGADDADKVLACYDGYTASTHGMIAGIKSRVGRMLSSPGIRAVGYLDEGQVLGYLVFDFENRGHFLQNDLRIQQLVYQNAQVLEELLAFLLSLADQFDWIVINTQDRYFHHLLDDPRNRSGDLIPSVFHESNTQGVGLMYRVVDLKRLLTSLTGMRFGPQALTLRFNLDDSLVPVNSDGLVVRFQDGQASITEGGDCDAVIKMDVSDFASLIMGSITLERQVTYGLAEVSQPTLVKEISDMFDTVAEPICMTAF